MLRKNIYTECGLANSSRGTVYDFLYSEDQNPKHDRPTAVLVDFPGYRGPRWSTDPDVPATVVPVGVATAHHNTDERQTRVNFPLDLAYGLTVYKAQGLTLDKVLLHVQTAEAQQGGRTYVGMSRVRDILDLCLRSAPTIGYEYFGNIWDTAKGQLKKGWKSRRREMHRLTELAERTAAKYKS